MANALPPVPLNGPDNPPIEEEAHVALSLLVATAIPLLELATPSLHRDVFSGCHPTTDAAISVVMILRAISAVGAIGIMYKEVLQE